MARHGKYYDEMIQSKEWRELRVRVLREHNGLCAWCLKKGYVVSAEVVHHLVEVETGRTQEEQRRLMFARSNVVGICRRCHSDHHNQQGYHSTAKVLQRQAERKATWLDDMAKRFKPR